MLNKELLAGIADVWYSLLQSKKLQSKTVHDKMPREYLSIEDQKKPEILEQLNKSGYYEVVTKRDEVSLKALDYLAKLGYVEKRNDTIHYFEYHYQVFPYEPYVSPFGWVGITSNEKFVSSYVLIDSKHYQHFTETAEQFKTQVAKKIHRHITVFEYGESFSYDTVVYELLDKYFDAIQLWYDESKDIFIVQLCQPYVRNSTTTGDRKQYKVLQEVAPDIFLEHRGEIDKIIDELEWKKKSKGILVIDNKAYFFVHKQEEKEETGFLKKPDFFDEGLASKENFLSRIFEDATSQYLSSKHTYSTSCRLKPEYLDGLEIDVFAEKGTAPKTITVCECKLRFNDSPVTVNEIKYFHMKILKIKEYESKRGQVKFYFDFITNADKIDQDAMEFAKQNHITIRVASLPNNWQERSDWQINELRVLG